MNEICLGVEPVLQPSPKRNPGGDCFACALTAALRWIYQRPDIAFDVCWDFFKSESGSLCNAWPGMRQALYAADSHFWKLGRLEIFADIVQPTFEPEIHSHTWFGGMATDFHYARRLEGWLRGGFVALTEIDHAGRGPVVDGKWNNSDHFVLVDGVRHYWKPHSTVEGASSAESDVHVVCSSRGAYWIGAADFTFKHGAAGWWLVRRDGR